MKTIKMILAVCASAVLVACGGGGGGGGSTTAPVPLASAATPLSASNYSSVATPTAAALVASSTVDDTLDILSSASSERASQALSANPMQLALFALENFGTIREQVAAVNSTNRACPVSGSLSGSFNDADNSTSFSSGDTLSATVVNCVLAAGQPAANGSFSMTLNSLTRGAGNVITNLNTSMSFTNFSVDGTTLNGVATLAGNPNGASSVTYSNLSSTRRGITTIHNFTASKNSLGQVTFSGLITVGNNTYTISTVNAVTYGLNSPNAGTLRITDANNNRVDLVMSPSALNVSLFLNGATVASNSFSVAWSAL
jgi:hypothetical protein